MITNGVFNAVRAINKNVVLECKREKAFLQMYQVLGDKEKQEQIRLSTPDPHCPHLKVWPIACTDCPESLNPFENKETGDLAKSLYQFYPMLDDIADLVSHSDLGYPISRDEITPEEFAAMAGYKRARQIEQTESLATLIAAALGASKQE